MTTTKDLDRLISRTELNPVNKQALKGVRKAIIGGRCGNPEVGTGKWSIKVETIGGMQARMTFSFKRDKSGN